MPLTILVVDDEPGIRLSISDYLELCGYSTLTATNGEEGLAMAEKASPNLIVTDIVMPRLDGYEFVRRVRRLPAFRLIPVVFLTAKTQTHERIKGYQLGCDAYLPKPFELEEVAAVVRNLLDRTQLFQTELLTRTTTPGTNHSGSTDVKTEENADRKPVSVLSFTLTNREQEVLRLLAEGQSNAQIGERLHLSPRTIEKYVSSLLSKSNTSNRAELVRFALEHHLAS
ncbi:response regulator transcription factor [Leptolyngbya sp. FACHB-261]|uniref:response regulator transcription factor n=1 Tax=Leptolyngbya sp. FACHB-261 TaxID=2692806 RepID=UPI001688E074|nr:response regulator transcription factor [Leptolyngbya sp. FACHB-261]MBD2102251.1 response regulator transcription factor [Leptolyngbya sp. FACHB-261]